MDQHPDLIGLGYCSYDTLAVVAEMPEFPAIAKIP